MFKNIALFSYICFIKFFPFALKGTFMQLSGLYNACHCNCKENIETIKLILIAVESNVSI